MNLPLGSLPRLYETALREPTNPSVVYSSASHFTNGNTREIFISRVRTRSTIVSTIGRSIDPFARYRFNLAGDTVAEHPTRVLYFIRIYANRSSTRRRIQISRIGATCRKIYDNRINFFFFFVELARIESFAEITVSDARFRVNRVGGEQRAIIFLKNNSCLNVPLTTR